MDKVLISGGLGFIGYEIALKLLKFNYAVSILDIVSAQVHTDVGVESKLNILNNYKQFSFIKGDVRNHKDWEQALPGASYIIHLAAETGTGQSMYEIGKYVDVNVNGTAVLLDTLIVNKFPVKRIILSSSRSVYGEGKYFCEQHAEQYPKTRSTADLEKGIFEPLCPHCSKELMVLPTDELSPLNPLSVYATTKSQQEELIRYVNTILNIPVTIFRYQNVYGIGQSLNNPYTGILSIFSTRIRNGKPIEIFEDGKESRDFVYIDDVVNATIQPILQPSDHTEIINVGTGVATSVLIVAKEIIKSLDIRVDLKLTGKSRAGDIRHNIADISQLKERYNFTPACSFTDGLNKFLTWVTAQPIAKDNYDSAINELKEKGLYK